jgi:Zn-finger nucleic acid-binding protein
MASIPVAARDGDGDGRCPRCRGVLFEGRSGDVVLQGCGGCGGIWVDNESAGKALARSDREVADLSTRAAANARVRVATEALGLPCPECGEPLERTRIDRAHVDVDVCRHHGTWFDRAELGIVLRAHGLKAPAYPPPVRILRPLTDEPAPDFRASSPVDWTAAASVAGGVVTVFAALLTLGSDDRA